MRAKKMEEWILWAQIEKKTSKEENVSFVEEEKGQKCRFFLTQICLFCVCEFNVSFIKRKGVYPMIGSINVIFE